MRAAPTLRFGLLLATVVMAASVAACATTGADPIASADARYAVGPLLHRDDFRSGLAQWSVELERGGTVAARDGVLDIDVPAGATVWFRTELRGPVMIEYEAVAVSEGGPNDRVSDLNAFWMATVPRRADGRPWPRSGAFADYDGMLTYYVGQGGNGNTTTRMRRYVGEASNRPLLPEHDLSDAAEMLGPNAPQTVRLIAAGGLIQYWRDGAMVFELDDPQPYARGWFGIRTTASHLRIRNVRIHALTPAAASRSDRRPGLPTPQGAAD